MFLESKNRTNNESGERVILEGSSKKAVLWTFTTSHTGLDLPQENLSGGNCLPLRVRRALQPPDVGQES